MKGITRKTKLLLGVACLMLLVSCAVAVGVWYMIGVYKTRLDIAQAETKHLIEQRGQLDALEKMAKATKDDRSELAHYTVKESDVISFLSLIEQTATNKGVQETTHAIAVVESDAKTHLGAFTVDLELFGSLHDIKNVVDLYEHLPYQSRIEKISFDHSGSGAGGWHAVLTLKVTEVLP